MGRHHLTTLVPGLQLFMFGFLFRLCSLDLRATSRDRPVHINPCLRICHIQFRGQVDEGEINARSPLQMTLVHADETTTLLAAGTDESGLIGPMRHLHGLGFVFLSVKRHG